MHPDVPVVTDMGRRVEGDPLPCLTMWAGAIRRTLHLLGQHYVCPSPLASTTFAGCLDAHSLSLRTGCTPMILNSILPALNSFIA